MGTRSLARSRVRPLTSPGLVLAIATAVVALPTAAAGALPSGTASPTLAAANSTTYQDSTGEDPAAPDITTIVVSNDDAGVITFRTNIPNRSQYTTDMAIAMFIDSDANQATGDLESLGADYIIELFRGEIILFKWDGTDYPVSATQASLSYSWSGGPTVRINASDLNNTRRLNFDVIALSNIAFDPVTGEPDFANAKRDSAPVIGFFTYEVKITPATLVVRRVTTTPATPVAGKPFTMRLVAARSDTGAVLQNGRVTCIGRVGNVRLRAQSAGVTGGAAVCTWLIPKTAKGKTFRGSTKVVFEGLGVSRSISRKIR